MNDEGIDINDIEDFVTFGYPRFHIAKGVHGRIIQLQNDDFEIVISVTDNLRAENLKKAWSERDGKWGDYRTSKDKKEK